MLGVDKVGRLLEKNVIEIAPLAYMRGRTLNDAFVILDEAQNTSIEQMKMFLTRLGFGSTAVITGDLTQVDLPKHQKSGLKDAVEVLRGVDGVSFTFFEARATSCATRWSRASSTPTRRGMRKMRRAGRRRLCICRDPSASWPLAADGWLFDPCRSRLPRHADPQRKHQNGFRLPPE